MHTTPTSLLRVLGAFSHRDGRLVASLSNLVTIKITCFARQSLGFTWHSGNFGDKYITCPALIRSAFW